MVILTTRDLNSNLIIFKGSNMLIQWIFTFVSILNLYFHNNKIKKFKGTLVGS
jgi:hypothetical protein